MGAADTAAEEVVFTAAAVAADSMVAPGATMAEAQRRIAAADMAAVTEVPAEARARAGRADGVADILGDREARLVRAVRVAQTLGDPAAARVRWAAAGQEMQAGRHAALATAMPTALGIPSAATLEQRGTLPRLPAARRAHSALAARVPRRRQVAILLAQRPQPAVGPRA
jgi:hypothetical protein